MVDGKLYTTASTQMKKNNLSIVDKNTAPNKKRFLGNIICIAIETKFELTD